MNENNQAKNQSNHQASNQNNQQGFENEAFTVINGKVVSVKVARQMEEQTTMKTGIQPHHDNSSEAVKAGEVAKNQQGLEKSEVAHVNIRPANVQSGQKHVQKSGMTEEQKMQQAEHDAVQNAMEDPKGKATKTNKKG